MKQKLSNTFLLSLSPFEEFKKKFHNKKRKEYYLLYKNEIPSQLFWARIFLATRRMTEPVRKTLPAFC